MGYQGAEWLDREERDVEEEPDIAIAALDLKTGMVVADIGAGSGYMTVRLAKKVGPTGKVYGEDIQPEMIDLLQKRMVKEKITNVVPLLGLTDDPSWRPPRWTSS
jgi:ubiquinone/menaquinone biosynthesis C-methylase UbiE